MTLPLHVLVILRHENSLNTVHDFLATRNIRVSGVALDPVEFPSLVPNALREISNIISQKPDAIVIGTKVYDSQKQDKSEPPLQLIEFLEWMKSRKIGTIPICMTHLGSMPDSLWQKIKNTELNVSFVDNDNLKNDGMNNLGPLILRTLNL